MEDWCNIDARVTVVVRTEPLQVPHVKKPLGLVNILCFFFLLKVCEGRFCVTDLWPTNNEFVTFDYLYPLCYLIHAFHKRINANLTEQAVEWKEFDEPIISADNRYRIRNPAPGIGLFKIFLQRKITKHFKCNKN